MNLLKTFFYSLKRSLFEPKYYKEDIAKAKFWFSYKFLWFFLFLLIIINTFTIGGQYIKNRPYIQPGITKFINYAENFYPAKLELKIKNGQLSTNVKEPYIFDVDKSYFKETKKHFLVIDTKGSIDNYPDYDAYILATKNAVIYPSKSNNNQPNEISVYYFRDLKQDFTLNKKVYSDLLNIIRPYTGRAVFYIDIIVMIALIFYLIFGSLIWTSTILLGLVFMTFFVWIVSLISKKKLSYGTLYRFGMHAVTWPIIISEFVKLLGLTIPGLYPIAFFIFILVILFS